MRKTSHVFIAAACLLAAAGVRAAPDALQIVVCAPGSPGTTDEARPSVDAFATAVSAKARVPVTAVYDPSEDGGAKRLAQAGIGIVSLPFFLKHEKALGLHARLIAVQKGRPALEKWALVAQKGRVKDAAGLAGFTLMANTAFAPAFIRGVVLGSYGKLPADVKLVQSVAILSALRRAANGDPIAVVADGPQEASLASLPFAAKLDVVTRSPPVPAGLVVTIDARVSAAQWKPVEAALLGLHGEETGAHALAGVQMDRFVALDEKALDAARTAFASAQ